ncbi:MAG: DUF3078 domain-containing protein [Chitinophagales bacterium]
MRDSLLLFAFLSLFYSSFSAAQTEVVTDSIPKYWTKGAGIGFDLGQLLHINPTVGGGLNQIGFGSSVGYFANYKKNRVAWDNTIFWQFGIQKLGSGVLPSGKKIPFQKTIDNLQVTSKVGNKTKEGSKFYYAAELNFNSQFLPTYPGNLLRDTSTVENTSLIAKLFAPARIQLATGIDYKPNQKVSIFYAPLAYKSVLVLDDDIARLGFHGNPVRYENDVVVEFRNVDHQFGSFAAVNYSDTYLNQKVVLTSKLNLFSNYLDHPERIDIDLNANIAVNLFKNIQLSMMLRLFYDYDVLVQKSDFNTSTEQWEIGRGVSFAEQLLIKYNVTF